MYILKAEIYRLFADSYIRDGDGGYKELPSFVVLFVGPSKGLEGVGEKRANGRLEAKRGSNPLSFRIEFLSPSFSFPPI